MPWWVWLLITLFMLCMIVLGIFLVVVSLLRIVKNCSALSSKISSKFEHLNTCENSVEVNRDPLFTRPLKDAAELHEKTLKFVIARKNLKREKHKAVWERWSKKSLREEDL